MEIRTPRLLLRKAKPSDLPRIHEILSNARAMAYWSTPPHETTGQSKAWLESTIKIDAQVGEDFVVEYLGVVIGKAGLYRFPEIGFIFHPNAWGQGLASEALTAVLDRAFNLHGLPAVEADVDPRNEACLKLLIRLGFREVRRQQRTWLVGDNWCDSVYLALEGERWLRPSLH